MKLKKTIEIQAGFAMEAEGVVRFFQGEAGDPRQKQKNLLFLRSRPTVPAVAFKILVFVFNHGGFTAAGCLRAKKGIPFKLKHPPSLRQQPHRPSPPSPVHNTTVFLYYFSKRTRSPKYACMHNTTAVPFTASRPAAPPRRPRRAAMLMCAPPLRA
jgi:hypothetical protein